MKAAIVLLLATSLSLGAHAAAQNSAHNGAQDDATKADSAKTPETEAAVEGKPVRCITTDRIMSYAVESDTTVRLSMMGKKDVIMSLRRACPQLHYHNYIAYTPVNGQLCAKIDDIVTRTGLPCRIASFTEIPRGAPTPKSLSGEDDKTPDADSKK